MDSSDEENACRRPTGKHKDPYDSPSWKMSEPPLSPMLSKENALECPICNRIETMWLSTESANSHVLVTDPGTRAGTSPQNPLGSDRRRVRAASESLGDLELAHQNERHSHSNHPVTHKRCCVKTHSKRIQAHCSKSAERALIESYAGEISTLRPPDQSNLDVPPDQQRFVGYFRIAHHYKSVFEQIFTELKHTLAIVVEDDLDISIDFFDYFAALAPLLLNDTSLYCVSAWNDNGKKELIDASCPNLLYR
nr:unnamed protein product [Spirometra erinaceieuropaei]